MSKSVILSKLGNSALLTLNRPKGLNSLNIEMCKLVKDYLKEIQESSSSSAMVMKGAGDKAFCAGGDVKSLYDDVVAGGDTLGKGIVGRMSTDFFKEEYEMNYMLGTSPIPQVSIWNGIVMGGGVGISVLGDFRVATEKTMFAMPETAIGLFPDVGSSAWLPHLHPGVGEYIGLTGCRLGPADLIHSGIATHYIPSAKLPELEAAIEQQVYVNPVEARKTVSGILKGLNESPPVTPEQVEAAGGGRNHSNLIRDNKELITQCFGNKQSFAEIMDALNTASVGTASSIGNAWATKTLESLNKMSPTSLLLTFEQLRRGANLDLRGCLIMEYRLANACMRGNDFREGVRALLVDKDNKPQWSPASVDEVSPEFITSLFESLGEHDLELELPPEER
jgi:enoyl-CoA hydratase/carnithine racemase